ncbi:type I phosphomannose isomerase catalytic subunit [Flavobacterium chungnamense]|uniref:Phosphohexomutase n=1 Tax=Flavobacterium chungnamense TaxID=706182 RepID=A0ABP7UEJ3_9FLAO
MKFYPLQFQPILKDRIWGGTKLKDYLNKPISSEITGESWEISTVENDVSVIANGVFEGKSLNELINEFPEQVLGTNVYKKFGKQFPLLFKYLDARQDLSIQVHPNDELAAKRHNSFGKTEMWYVMQADENARLIVGFKENSSQKEYIENLENKTLIDILDTKKVKKGDVYFLETGTVHAIGAGTVIAEIQQTSDITYRLYDFDRVDANGNTRDLHVDLALDAINYDVVDAEKSYSKVENEANAIVDCPYFTTNFIPLDGSLEVVNDENSFLVYMCVEGSFELKHNDVTYSYKTGDTVLIPAKISEFEIHGKASMLEIYIS